MTGGATCRKAPTQDSAVAIARLWSRSVAVLVVLLTVVPVWRPVDAQEAASPGRKRRSTELPGVIWRDPGDVRTLDLLHGAGGPEHAPDPDGHYVFIKEDLHGANPKFDVEDEHGTRWRVKLGSARRRHPKGHDEQHAEVAATRLLWAAGYFVDEDYYVPEITVAGLPVLRRGQQYVRPGGRVESVRLKRRPRDVRKAGKWGWFANPFVGTRELNGLRVMMALLNNWDLAPENNTIEVVDGERRFLVSDVGASFGRTGNYFTRSKGVLPDYADAPFIDRLGRDSVDFVMHTRPMFLAAFSIRYYWEHSRVERITRQIPRADARWLGSRLAGLSDEQLRDCFRAAGYPPDMVDGYTAAVRRRIAELNAL